MDNDTETTAQIVGGLNLRNVVDGGTVFEVNYNQQGKDDDKEEEECTKRLQNYLKLGCLDFGNSYDGGEPFSNISKKMQNLLPTGKVKKRILQEGYGYKPEESSVVIIHYNAYVQYEAQPFDSTYSRKKPFSFQIGNEEVIEGLEIAVVSMLLNEKAQFLIDPELAYRSGGLGRIPPDSIVLFDIELCEIRQPVTNNPEVDKKDFQICYPTCLALCVKGKNLFKLKDYDGAIKVYTTAIRKMEEAVLKDYDDQMKSEELLVRLYTNLLVSYTRAQNPRRGCIFAQKIYEMSKNKTFKVSSKVFFNHAKCLIMLGDFTRARRKLLEAKALEPNNSEIMEELNSLHETNRKYDQMQKNFGRALLK